MFARPNTADSLVSITSDQNNSVALLNTDIVNENCIGFAFMDALKGVMTVSPVQNSLFESILHDLVDSETEACTHVNKIESFSESYSHTLQDKFREFTLKGKDSGLERANIVLVALMIDFMLNKNHVSDSLDFKSLKDSLGDFSFHLLNKLLKAIFVDFPNVEELSVADLWKNLLTKKPYYFAVEELKLEREKLVRAIRKNDIYLDKMGKELCGLKIKTDLFIPRHPKAAIIFHTWRVHVFNVKEHRDKLYSKMVHYMKPLNRANIFLRWAHWAKARVVKRLSHEIKQITSEDEILEFVSDDEMTNNKPSTSTIHHKENTEPSKLVTGDHRGANLASSLTNSIVPINLKVVSSSVQFHSLVSIVSQSLLVYAQSLQNRSSAIEYFLSYLAKSMFNAVTPCLLSNQFINDSIHFRDLWDPISINTEDIIINWINLSISSTYRDEEPDIISKISDLKNPLLFLRLLKGIFPTVCDYEIEHVIELQVATQWKIVFTIVNFMGLNDTCLLSEKAILSMDIGENYSLFLFFVFLMTCERGTRAISLADSTFLKPASSLSLIKNLQEIQMHLVDAISKFECDDSATELQKFKSLLEIFPKISELSKTASPLYGPPIQLLALELFTNLSKKFYPIYLRNRGSSAQLDQLIRMQTLGNSSSVAPVLPSSTSLSVDSSAVNEEFSSDIKLGEQKAPSKEWKYPSNPIDKDTTIPTSELLGYSFSLDRLWLLYNLSSDSGEVKLASLIQNYRIPLRRIFCHYAKNMDKFYNSLLSHTDFCRFLMDIKIRSPTLNISVIMLFFSGVAENSAGIYFGQFIDLVVYIADYKFFDEAYSLYDRLRLLCVGHIFKYAMKPCSELKFRSAMNDKQMSTLLGVHHTCLSIIFSFYAATSAAETASILKSHLGFRVYGKNISTLANRASKAGRRSTMSINNDKQKLSSKATSASVPVTPLNAVTKEDNNFDRRSTTSLVGNPNTNNNKFDPGVDSAASGVSIATKDGTELFVQKVDSHFNNCLLFPATLTIDKFIGFAKDTKQISANLTVQTVNSICQGCIKESFPEELKDENITAASDIKELLFPEFVEILCALCIQKAPDPYANMVDKMSSFLNEMYQALLISSAFKAKGFRQAYAKIQS